MATNCLDQFEFVDLKSLTTLSQLLKSPMNMIKKYPIMKSPLCQLILIFNVTETWLRPNQRIALEYNRIKRDSPFTKKL